MIKTELFGKLQNGTEIVKFIITNNRGESVELLDYGASIQSIMVKDRAGKIEDVVLGAANAHSLNSFTYEGGTIGRVANRIKDGRFELFGKEIQLEKNLFGHFLHGASGNYATKIFDGEILNDNEVRFYLRDLGQGGFNCEADFWVTFTFDNESQLNIKYDFVSEDDTIFNPTNHTYFNLSGNYSDAREHMLQIDSCEVTSRDENGLPDGSTLLLAGTPADFRWEHSIMEAMQSDSSGYFKKKLPGFDEFYLLNTDTKNYVAKLSFPHNGRTMKVYTDMPCLVLFVNADRAPENGKNKTIYKEYAGVCLEAELVPNSINFKDNQGMIVRKNEHFISNVKYVFKTENL